MNYNDLGEGFTICNPTAFKEVIDLSFNNEEYTKNIDMYRIIGYTNNCVSGWNNYIRNNIIKDADKNIITKNDLIMSYETIVNEFMEIVINNSEEYIKIWYNVKMIQRSKVFEPIMHTDFFAFYAPEILKTFEMRSFFCEKWLLSHVFWVPKSCIFMQA